MSGTHAHLTTREATQPFAVSTCGDGMAIKAVLGRNTVALAWRCMR